MIKMLKQIAWVKHMLPSILIAILVIGGLSTYQAPKYTMPEPQAEAEVATDSEKEQEEEDIIVNDASFDLEDGFYEGTGNGYGGPITVKVEIKAKQIAGIEILSAPGEDAAFFNRAKYVITTMVEEQSVEVDVVAGATYSSKGIINAVKNALFGTIDTQEATTKPEATKLPDINEDVLYADGIYIGTGQGFGGTIKVQVTITNGKIAKIDILEASKETSTYLAQAKSILPVIITTQSTNVDVVSGATYTSNGILSAVRNALKKAVIDAEEVTNEDVDDKLEDQTEESEGAIQQGSIPYIDGVYYGTGDGFAGKITLALVIEKKTIKSVVITDTKDDEVFLAKAKAILQTMVEKQSVDVPIVSGATYSSKGILEAAKEAMEAAKRATEAYENGTTTEVTQAPTVKPTTAPTDDSHQPGESEESGKLYKDGTYYVTAVCSPDANHEFTEYTVSMKVTIEQDRIINMSDIAGSGESYQLINDAFIKRAVEGYSSFIGVVTQILNNGNADGIDIVAGATRTSYSIIQCAKNALLAARIQSDSDGTGSGGGSVAPTPAPSASPVPTTAPTIAPTLMPTSQPEASEGKYADGTYSVMEKCNPDEYNEFKSYGILMNVTISNDRIVAITDVVGTGRDYTDKCKLYIDLASYGAGLKVGVIPQIIDVGNADDVDVVSSATCSSNAIINGAKSALEKAKK